MPRQITLSAGALALLAALFVAFVAIAVLVTLLATGGRDSVPATAPTSPPEPTATARSTGTSEPTASPTSRPTPTPVPPTATPTAVPVQLLNGQELLKVGPLGLSTLAVTNGTTQDALVKLVTAGAKSTVRTVYVVRQSDWTIKGIAPGSYLLRFAVGNDWDPVLLRFQKNISFSAFEDPFDFVVTGGQYTTWEVTLNPVAGGTAQIDKIDPATFYQD